jgi:hypothetical protein
VGVGVDDEEDRRRKNKSHQNLETVVPYILYAGRWNVGMVC